MRYNSHFLVISLVHIFFHADLFKLVHIYNSKKYI